MVDLLERNGSVGDLKEVNYVGKRDCLEESAREKQRYSTFSEMYLERPVDVQMGTTCTVCTWRGVPTIDDW